MHERTTSQPRSRQMLLVLCFALCVLASALIARFRSAHRAGRQEAEARRLADGQEDLVQAIRDDDVERAKETLAAGIDPNQFVDGHPLLERCIQRGEIELLELFFASGADLRQIERIQNPSASHSPLLYAAMTAQQPFNVRLEMIRILIRQGADVRRGNTGRDLMDLAIENSESSLADTLRELGVEYGPREMAALNRLDELRVAVEQDPEILHVRFRRVYAGLCPTLLGIALGHGHQEIAEFLIESGAPLGVIEGQGQTLLHQAARGGNPALIRLLVARGLDVNAVDDYHDTPLTDCAWRASPEAVAALIEAGADVNSRRLNDDGTALHLAVGALAQEKEGTDAYRKGVAVIRLLLAAGADPSLPDSTGQTALDRAREISPDIGKLLTEAQRRE